VLIIFVWSMALCPIKAVVTMKEEEIADKSRDSEMAG
jgi:hypothetical protein